MEMQLFITSLLGDENDCISCLILARLCKPNLLYSVRMAI